MNVGRIAYEAYRRSADGKSLVSGNELPEWEKLGQSVRAAWDRAGRAVADEVLDEAERVGKLAAEAITMGVAETRDKIT